MWGLKRFVSSVRTFLQFKISIHHLILSHEVQDFPAAALCWACTFTAKVSMTAANGDRAFTNTIQKNVTFRFFHTVPYLWTSISIDGDCCTFPPTIFGKLNSQEYHSQKLFKFWIRGFIGCCFTHCAERVVMKSSVTKYYGCKRVTQCGLIANGCSQVCQDFSWILQFTTAICDLSINNIIGKVVLCPWELTLSQFVLLHKSWLEFFKLFCDEFHFPIKVALGILHILRRG